MDLESEAKYSDAFYYDYESQGFVDQDYTPVKLPVNTKILQIL